MAVVKFDREAQKGIISNFHQITGKKTVLKLLIDPEILYCRPDSLGRWGGSNNKGRKHSINGSSIRPLSPVIYEEYYTVLTDQKSTQVLVLLRPLLTPFPLSSSRL